MTVIYGMGEYGLFTYFKLREYGVNIDFFGDNNKAKQGYAINNITCISYEDLLAMDLDTNIIAAIKNPGTVMEDFKRRGFRNVYTKEEAVRLLLGRDYRNINEPLSDLKTIAAMKELIQDRLYNDSKKGMDPTMLCTAEMEDIEELITEYKKRRNDKFGY